MKLPGGAAMCGCSANLVLALVLDGSRLLEGASCGNSATQDRSVDRPAKHQVCEAYWARNG